MTLRRSPLILAGGTIVGVLTLVALFAPLLSPYDPRALAGDSLERPSRQHLLGTNDVGHDIFSEIIWGTRGSLTVALGAALLAIAVGVVVGVGVGLRGGLADTVAMRVVDVFLALPRLPLLVLIAALAGPSRAVLVLVIGAILWPVSARVLRSQTLTLRRRGFVDAANGFGGGLAYVVRRHLMSALGPVISANFVSVAAIAVVMEAGLAFLGLGDPSAVSWGAILSRAFRHPGLYFTPLWTWWVLPAGLAITITMMGFTFLGVGLEPRFNPRWARGQ